MTHISPAVMHPSSTPVRLTLQAEAAAIGSLCIAAFSQTDASWWLFAALILAPDLFMLGYLVNKRIGALCYNLGHSYLLPVVLGGIGVWGQSDGISAIALIWGAHIGLDRAIGYGLKYGTHFKDTHFGRV